MPESASHTNLVGSLVSWIATSYFAGDTGGILVDSPTAKDKPPKIGGFVPDAYAQMSPRELTVVGEAKTSKDLESPHTRDQLAAFLRWCQFNGGGVLVLAVPWPVTRLAASLVRLLKQRDNCDLVRTVILDKLSG